MYISAISFKNPCTNVSNFKKNVPAPSFKGYRSGLEHTPLMKILHSSLSGVKLCTDMNGVTNIINNLNNKYLAGGRINGSTEVTIIPDSLLPAFLGERVGQYDLRGVKGLCVAVGDKVGSIDTWNKAYEAITVLVPKKIF